DDVLVGDDLAVGGDDEARAGRGALPGLGLDVGDRVLGLVVDLLGGHVVVRDGARAAGGRGRGDGGRGRGAVAVDDDGSDTGAVVATTRDERTGTATTTVSTPASSGTVVPASSTSESTTLTAGEIYKSSAPGVVDLKIDASAEGSGFVVDQKGDVVTNAHVVE